MSAITEQTAQFISGNFKNPGNGSSYILEMFPGIYAQEIAEIKEIFSKDELTLIVNIFKTQELHSDMAGRMIFAPKIQEKINTCALFRRACLEIWAKSFWVKENCWPLEEYITS